MFENTYNRRCVDNQSQKPQFITHLSLNNLLRVMVTQLLPTVTHLGITEFDFRRISFQQTKSDEVVAGSLILDA